MNDFDADEKTPTTDHRTPELTLVCRECGGELTPIANGWLAPRDADKAWREWHGACVVTRSRSWSFCCRVGACWIGDERHDYERRKVNRDDAWTGIERRLTPVP